MAILAQLLAHPLTVPTNTISLLWAMPICLSIAIIYKSLRVQTITAKLLIRETMFLFLTIVGFMILAGAAMLAVAYLAKV